MSQAPNQIPTPPDTTLSTPSPTELRDTDPLSTAMPPSSTTRALKHIYLIVATTPVTTPTGPRLGIGRNGRLPWPMIRADMNYFRKVTTDGREVSSSPSSTTLDDNANTKPINSVIMGRKTYESIPPNFRPLSGRRNYIVTRGSPAELAERYRSDLMAQSEKAARSVKERYETTIDRPNLSDLSKESPEYRDLQMSESEFTTVTSSDGDARITSSNAAIEPVTITSSLTHAINDSDGPDRGNIFCIGGAEIYKLLLQDSSLRPRLRVLQTEIQRVREGEEYACDTFWPEELEEGVSGWKEVGKEVVERWLGVEVVQGRVDWFPHNGLGVRVRVRGWMQGG